MTLEEAAEKVLTVIIDHQKSWQSGNQGENAILDACTQMKAALKSYGDQRFIEGATAMREMAAMEAYAQCAQTRHVTLGDAASKAIRNLDPTQLKDTDHG